MAVLTQPGLMTTEITPSLRRSTASACMYMFSAAFGGSSQLGYGSMLAMLQFFVTVLVRGSLLILLRRREVQL